MKIYFLSMIFLWANIELSAQRIDSEKGDNTSKSKGIIELAEFVNSDGILAEEIVNFFGFAAKYKVTGELDTLLFVGEAKTLDPQSWEIISYYKDKIDFGINRFYIVLALKNERYNLSLLFKEDTVLGVYISGESENNKLCKWDTSQKEKYWKRHKEFYGVSPEEYPDYLQPFFKHQFISTKMVHLEFHPACIKMLKWVKYRRKKKLLFWLKSPNPRFQRLGVQGLYYLEKYRKVFITQSEREIIAHIINRDGIKTDSFENDYQLYVDNKLI